jgi:hypothetical protein
MAMGGHNFGIGIFLLRKHMLYSFKQGFKQLGNGVAHCSDPFVNHHKHSVVVAGFRFDQIAPILECFK